MSRDDPGRRYVYTATDPDIGDCHYWSDVPGGLDAWDPGNDPAVIGIVTTLPPCPVTPVLDPEARAWEVFRSWDLDQPEPRVTPPSVGITGLPTHLALTPPPAIVHAELLPDGRTLEVRARVGRLHVDWGDGTSTSHDPEDALGWPDGDASHTYSLKTCTPQYRSEHPSGGLCHPNLEGYAVTSLYVWVGEYSIGSGWIALGTLDRSSTVPYAVAEARGVNLP